MTAIVTHSVRRFIESTSSHNLSNTTGVVVLVLVIILLTERELLGAALRGRLSTDRLAAFDAAIVPLLLALIWIMAVRFAFDILRL